MQDFEQGINPEKSIHNHTVAAWISAIESLPQPKNGTWIIYKCAACEKHRGKSFVHLDIVRDAEGYKGIIFKQ